MNIYKIIYTGIILFPFLSIHKVKAQNREQHRSVTINQTVVDGKVISSDTVITYTDTTTRTINSKEISMELPYSKGSTVYIDNNYRKLNIKQSKDSKVRLTTTAFYYGEPAFTNEQWLEKLNIVIKNTDTGMVITSGSINSPGFTSTSWSNTTTDWNKVIAERNKAVIERNKAAVERIKAAFDRNMATAEREKATAERNKVLAERNSEIPNPPAPPIGTTITTNGSSAELRANGSGTINGKAAMENRSMTEVIADSWGSNNNAATVRGYSSNGYNTAVFDEKGNNVYSSGSLRREITLYIPADVKLNVVSKYADVTADHDLKNLKIKISNGSLDMVNADNVAIVSAYSNVSCGNLSNADITATNGKLSIKNADQLNVNTKYSKVEIDNCTTLKIKSISDDYDLGIVKTVSGTKTYGSFRIDKLTGSFDFKGSSADIKIRNIEPTVSAITIDNKYADVRLPVTNLKNYEVLFSGNYSSVFAPFERRDTTIKITKDTSETSSYVTSDGTVHSKTKPGAVPPEQNSAVLRYDDNRTIYATSDGSVISSIKPASISRSNTRSFVAAVGNTNGTHTIFKLICNSCNVDFK